MTSEFSEHFHEETKYAVYAYPHARVSRILLRNKPEHDTAYYDFKKREIVFTETLADGLCQHLPSLGQQMAAAKSVVQHEAAHASMTRFWPDVKTPVAQMLVNWWEDWRINRASARRFPAFGPGLVLFGKALEQMRGKSSTPREEAGELLAFMDSLWPRAWEEKKFHHAYDNARARLSTEKLRQTALRVRDDVLASYDAQPTDLGDLRSLSESSLEFTRRSYAILEELEPILQLKKMEEAAKALGALTREEIERELERRKSGGKGDERFKDIPTAVLEFMLLVSDKPEGKPREEAETVGPQEAHDRSGGTGAGQATGASEAFDIAEASGDQVQTASFRLRPMIRTAEKILANSMSDERIHVRGSFERRGSTGTKLHPSSIARIIDSPGSERHPFVREDPVHHREGDRKLAYSHLLFAVDGSGSMSSVWKETRDLLFIFREVCHRSRIRMAAVLNHNNDTAIICAGGLSSGDRLRDLGRITDSEAAGNSDFAEHSLLRSSAMVANACPDPRMSRLILVSDCITQKDVVSRVEAVRANIAMPSLLLAIRRGDTGLYEEGHLALKKAAVHAGFSHSTINLDCLQGEPAFLASFRETCQWMRSPDRYASMHGDPVDPVLVASADPLPSPKQPAGRGLTEAPDVTKPSTR